MADPSRPVDTITLPPLSAEELETLRAINDPGLKVGALRPGEWRCKCGKIRAASNPGCPTCGEKP